MLAGVVEMLLGDLKEKTEAADWEIALSET